MTIECYNSRCGFHSCRVSGEEGPFCYEDGCRLTEEELRRDMEQIQKEERMIKIIKATPIDRNGRENTWISMTEFPGEKIAIEGIRMNPENRDDLRSQRILLSKEAIAVIAPALIEWLEQKSSENMMGRVTKDTIIIGR